MEVYIIDGRELTLEQFEALAKEAGLNTEQYKALYNVEVKQDPNALDAAAGEDKASLSLESQLANTKSDWEKWKLENSEKESRGLIGKSRLYQQKRVDFIKKEKDLTNAITAYNLDPANIDFSKPETVINQNEDSVKNAIKKQFPFYNVEDGTAGNLLKIQTSEGFKEIDLNPIFSNNKKQALETIKYLNQASKDLKDEEIVGLSMNKLANNIKETGSVDAVNTLLEGNTPYQLEKTIVPGKSSTGLQGVSTPDVAMYNVVKDGKIISSLPIDKVDDFLRDNITEVEFNKMNNTSVKALETVAGMRRAYIDQERQRVEIKPATKIKYYKDNFSKDAIKVLDDLGFTEEDKEIVETYIANTQNQKGELQLATIPGMARRQGVSPNQIIKELTALDGLPDELKKRLVDAGFVDAMKSSVDVGIKDVAFKEVNKGAPTMLEDMLTEFDKGELLDLANYYNTKIAGITLNKETGDITEVAKIDVENLDLDGSIRDQIKISGDISDTNKFIIKRAYQKDEKEAIKAYEDFYPAKFESLNKEVETLVNQLPEGVNLSVATTPSGPLLSVKANRKVSASENETIKNISGRLASIQSTYHNLEFDRKNSANKIVNNRNSFYDQLQDAEKNDDIIATANKEFGLGNLLVKDVNDAFSTLALTVPTLFDSEWAIGKQKQLNDKNNYYKTMTEPEFSAEYIFRTLGQQSANITLALATAGVGGSVLGLSNTVVANTIGIGFGTVSGTQTFRDLNIEVDVYEEAEKQEKIYKAALDRGEISEYNYTMAMRDINTTLAMKKLDDGQIMTASISNALIEGTLTRFLGTAANSIALVKNFNTINRQAIADGLFKGGFTKAINTIGKPLVGRTGLETVEELGIFAGQNFITDTAILGRGADRETFLKGANETFWATVVTAGMSQSTGITYSGMNSMGLIKEYEKALNKKRFALNDLSLSIQNATDPNIKKSLLFDYQQELIGMGLDVDSNSVDLLNLTNEDSQGNSDLKRLIGTQLIKQDYLRSLGIQPGTDAQQALAIEALKDKSTKQEKKDIETTLGSLDNQINNIKEKGSKASNYDVAKNALGATYTIYDNKLKDDVDYKAASTKDKLVKIINAVRQDTVLENTDNAKSDPAIVEAVESRYADLNDKQKDKIYENIGANMALQKGRGFSNQLNIDRQAASILSDVKGITVVGVKTDQQIADAIEEAGLTGKEAKESYDKLKEGKTFGLVIGKTIITQNEDAMKADLDKGIIRAGTVVLHELNHIIDDAKIKPENRKKYAVNLFEAASTSSNRAIQDIHNETIDMLSRIYGETVITDFKNKSAKFQDEYTKYLQEQLFAYEDVAQIEQDDSFVTRLLNNTNPNNLNTPEKALSYLAASNSAFRKGKVSSSTKKAIESFEGNINESQKSDKDINNLAIEYKDLGSDLNAQGKFLLDTNFLQQYTNTALAAMGYDVRAGDITTDEATSFVQKSFPRVIRTYKPETEGSFTNWVYSTVGREGKGFFKEKIEANKDKIRITEKSQFVSKETAEDAIDLEARKKAEGKGKSLVDPRKLPGIPADIDNLVEVNKNEVVINPESRSYTTDFRSISDKYGSKIAGAIYGINPSKLKKGADLTYGQNKVVDGRKVISEAEKIQGDYVNVQDAKKLISLFPEYSISTPTAVTTEQGQETKVDKEVQGRSLGIAPSVLDFFYETYIDPKALNKETKKDAITNPKGRAKGTSSQPYVRRLKPEFMGNITNETIAKVQKKLGITGRGEFNIPPKGKARTEFGRLLIGLANLKGAIVANTVVDQKIQALIKKGEIKSARTPEQITASTRAGRSKVQFSEKGDYALNAMQLSRILPKVTGNFKQLREVEFLFWNIKQGRKSDGTEKTMFNRNLPLPENLLPEGVEEETVIEGASRIINDFLKTYPQYRNYFKQATVFGIDRSLYGVAELFKKSITSVKADQAIVDREAMTSSEQLTNAYVKEIETKNKDYVARQKAKIKVMYDFAKAQEAYLKENKNNAWLFDEIRSQATNSQQSPYRTLFPVYLVEVDFNGKPLRNVRGTEEHSTPQNLIGTLLGKAVVDQRVDEIFPIVKALAMQGWLSNDVDNKLNEDFSKSMPYDLLNKAIKLYDKGELILPDGTLAAIRMSESNVDLSFQMYIPTGQTLSEIFFGTNFVKLENQKQLMRDLFDGTRSQVDTKKEAKKLVKIQETVDKTFKKDAPVVIAKDNKADKAMADARNSIEYKESRKGISVFDFDDTLAQSNSNVLYTMPDGTTGSLTAGEFAVEASGLTELGAEFNFSEFNEVKEGRKGPLADLAIKRQGKFGSKDIFVLTARPQAAAINIKKFLDEIGLNIPLANITGLENGTAEAKAEWMVGKYADGYNDFYFADDAFKNVEAVRNVFDVLDIKSEVQQARVKFSEKLDTDFNDMIERNMGVKSEAVYSDILARRKGKNQKRFAFFIPPSADDFRGLTMYTFAGKGKQGELDQDFFDKALIKPYMGGINAMELAKNRVKNAYKVLQKTSPNVRKKLTKKIGGTKYTHDQAIRIYLWNKDGVVIPGLSKTDQNQLVKLVEANTDLVAYAEGVKLITKQETYVPPNEFWDGTTIIGDLGRLSREINRNEYLKEFNDNADILFSPKNMNKIEAVYGFRVREALENSLYRMKTGSNKAAGSGRIVTAWNNWVNNSVGAIMFFNRRSALLQMLSAGNFVNWSDNNPLKAGLAFANQPQYWKDVVYIFNSPKLKARRQGLEGDIQEKEIAEASRKGGMEGVLSYLLKIGFTPTQIADSIAISTGGASFYRNRINTYKKEGYTTEDAEKKAFDDFSAISDETQQSADPMLISSQQAGVLGRLVLAFQNTPMQYTRLMKKAGQDLINRRGDAKTNISKILYYGFIQNLIFSTLQNAMFAFVPGFEDDEDEPDFKTDKERDAWLAKQGNREDKKVVRVANNMVDTILRGSGLAGAVVSTIKNVIMVYNEREDMTVLQRSRANADLLIALTSISPPISSKIRKINNALDIEDFEKDVIAERGYSVMIDDRFQLSPQYDVIGNVASAALNLPLDRVFNEVNSITEALDDRNSAYQRLALGLGWKTWDVNAKIEEHDLIKTEAKAKRKVEGIEKGKITRKTNKEIKKDHERLRRSIIFKLPKPIKDSLIRKEREDKKITAIYKLNQLKAKYIE